MILNAGHGGPGGETEQLPFLQQDHLQQAFNSHFDKGVIFTVDSYGLEFKIAANLTSDKIEFIAYENWNGANAGNSTGNQSVMAGELNKTTGVLKKGMKRIRSTCTTSSCSLEPSHSFVCSIRSDKWRTFKLNFTFAMAIPTFGQMLLNIIWINK